MKEQRVCFWFSCFCLIESVLCDAHFASSFVCSNSSYNCISCTCLGILHLLILKMPSASAIFLTALNCWPWREMHWLSIAINSFHFLLSRDWNLGQEFVECMRIRIILRPYRSVLLLGCFYRTGLNCFYYWFAIKIALNKLNCAVFAKFCKKHLCFCRSTKERVSFLPKW